MLRLYVSNIEKDAVSEIWTFYMSFIGFMKQKKKIISLVIQVGKWHISLFAHDLCFKEMSAVVIGKGHKIFRHFKFFFSVRYMTLRSDLEQ